MSEKHIFVVDGNSILHANHNATPLTVGGMQVQAIFGFLRSMRVLLRSSARKEVIVLWDGKAQFRFDIFPEYKANRVAKDAKEQAHKDALTKQKPFIEKALSLLGVRQMRSPLLEADDLAGHLIPKLVAAGYRVTMVSGDQDWIQEVGDMVEWFDPIRDRRVDMTNLLTFTGYETTAAFVEGKALQGDTSDNISGVGGIGKDGAPIFLAQWKTVYRFFQAVDNGTVGKLGKVHTRFSQPEGRAIFERNMNLMDWRRSRKPEPGEIITTPAMVDTAKFELLCQRLAFASILREFTPFLNAFGIRTT